MITDHWSDLVNRCDHWSLIRPRSNKTWTVITLKKHLRTPMIIIKKIFIYRYIYCRLFCWSMSPSKFYKLRIPPFWKSIFLSLYIVPRLQVCLKFRESISREIQFWIYELASTKFRFIEMEWSPVWEFGKELNMNLLSTFPFPIQCLALPPR